MLQVFNEANLPGCSLDPSQCVTRAINRDRLCLQNPQPPTCEQLVPVFERCQHSGHVRSHVSPRFALGDAQQEGGVFQGLLDGGDRRIECGDGPGPGGKGQRQVCSADVRAEAAAELASAFSTFSVRPLLCGVSGRWGSSARPRLALWPTAAPRQALPPSCLP